MLVATKTSLAFTIPVPSEFKNENPPPHPIVAARMARRLVTETVPVAGPYAVSAGNTPCGEIPATTFPEAGNTVTNIVSVTTRPAPVCNGSFWTVTVNTYVEPGVSAFGGKLTSDSPFRKASGNAKPTHGVNSWFPESFTSPLSFSHVQEIVNGNATPKESLVSSGSCGATSIATGAFSKIRR